MNPLRPQGAPQAAVVGPSGVASPVAPQSGVVTPRGLQQSDAAANRGAPATSAPTRPSTATAQEIGQVRQVQQALQSRGYDVGPIDGVMGEQTERALRRFQREEGMIITGDVTQATRQALGIGPSTAEERAAQLRAASGANR
jgi:peptidoglycan hydrolase-like protein with peptidoglycan-binding domain